MRRFVTETSAASELGIPLSTFRHWVQCGKLPPAVEGINLFDIKAIHAACDKISGLENAGNAYERVSVHGRGVISNAIIGGFFG